MLLFAQLIFRLKQSSHSITVNVNGENFEEIYFLYHKLLQQTTYILFNGCCLYLFKGHNFAHNHNVTLSTEIIP